MVMFTSVSILLEIIGYRYYACYLFLFILIDLARTYNEHLHE